MSKEYNPPLLHPDRSDYVQPIARRPFATDSYTITARQGIGNKVASFHDFGCILHCYSKSKPNRERIIKLIWGILKVHLQVGYLVNRLLVSAV